MTRTETSAEYCQRRANETGRPYMAVTREGEAHGHGLWACTENRRTARETWPASDGYITRIYRPNRERLT